MATVVGRYTDPRIRLHQWPTHTDLCENFNRTMLLCRSEWVQPLGVDDRLVPHCLETMAARMRAVSDRPIRLSAVLSAVRRVDSRGSRQTPVLWPRARKDPERCAQRCFLAALLADGREPVEYWDGRLCT